MTDIETKRKEIFEEVLEKYPQLPHELKEIIVESHLSFWKYLTYGDESTEVGQYVPEELRHLIPDEFDTIDIEDKKEIS